MNARLKPTIVAQTPYALMSQDLSDVPAIVAAFTASAGTAVAIAASVKVVSLPVSAMLSGSVNGRMYLSNCVGNAELQMISL